MNLTYPDYQERVTFLGSNGSGKSVLAKELLSPHYPRIVVIDVKHDFEPYKPYTLIKKPNDWRWSFRVDGRILYRPSPEYNNGPWLDEVLRRLYLRAQKTGKKKPFIIYVDEALYLSKVGATQWLAALAVSGRSLGVGLWVSSQRPKWIPVEVRSETWRWYVFFLDYDEDAKEMVKYTHGRISVDELQEPKQSYSFWEIKRDTREGGKKIITHYPPINHA